jgi:hypothetical protein
MATTLSVLTAEIAAPTTLATGTTLQSSNYVRVVNTASAAVHTVNVGSADSADVGSYSLAGYTDVILKKGRDEVVYASNAAIKITSVTPPRS